MRLSPMFWAGFWAFLLDQVSKYLVVHAMGLAQSRAVDVLPPLLNFRYGENTGINFGLFGGDPSVTRWILVIVSTVICLGIYAWVRRGQGGFWVQVSAGLLIGGALGNVVDRLLYGYVLDFLNLKLRGTSEAKRRLYKARLTSPRPDDTSKR